MAKKKTLEEWGEIFEKLRGEEEWQTLIRQASQCIKEWPDAFLGYVVRGVAKNELGQHEEAIKDYDKAIELEPNFAWAYHNRGRAKAELGHYAEAIKDYDKAIALKPDDATAYNNRGGAKTELGHYEEAVKDYDMAIELEPDDATAYSNRGSAKNELSQHEDAIKDCDKAIELKPNFAWAYNNRGFAKNNLGRYKEAIKDYDKAIELEPDNQNFHNGRAIALASITAANTRETLEREYKRQLKDVQNISTITENFRKDIEFLEEQLYGKTPSDRSPSDGEPPFGEPSSGGEPPSCKLHFVWSHLFRCFSNRPDKKHIGWIKQAELAASHARWFLLVIALISYVGFFFLHQIPGQFAIGDISFLDILQLNAFVLLLYSPFLIFNKHLSDRANRGITLLHAVKRDKDRLSFWAAQANDDKTTKKSRLAPAVLEHLHTNSTADISMKMMHNRRSWRGTKIKEMPDEIPLKIAARLDDIEQAIKKPHSD